MSSARPFESDAEVLGAVILAITQALNSDEFIPILEKHGLTNIQPTAWYSAKMWFDVLNEVAGNKNSTMNLIDAALKVSEMIPQASTDGTIHGAFVTANDTYYMNHHGYIGEIRVESTKDNEVVVSAYSPYPDDYLYGAFYGHARRHSPADANMRIYREKPYIYRIVW